MYIQNLTFKNCRAGRMNESTWNFVVIFGGCQNFVNACEISNLQFGKQTFFSTRIFLHSVFTFLCNFNSNSNLSHEHWKFFWFFCFGLFYNYCAETFFRLNVDHVFETIGYCYIKKVACIVIFFNSPKLSYVFNAQMMQYRCLVEKKSCKEKQKSTQHSTEK